MRGNFFRLDIGSATADEQARTNVLLTGEMARLVRFYGVNKDGEQPANITIAVSRGEVNQLFRSSDFCSTCWAMCARP